MVSVDIPNMVSESSKMWVKFHSLGSNGLGHEEFKVMCKHGWCCNNGSMVIGDSGIIRHSLSQNIADAAYKKYNDLFINNKPRTKFSVKV